jgi:hypothetical protein
MSTNQSRTKSVIATVGAAVATAALPAFLFTGAGTAVAGTSVAPTSDALGVTVKVTSTGNALNRSSGLCFYTATPANVPFGVLAPLPVYDIPFVLQENTPYNLWFPGIQTGTTWDVTVECQNGTNSPPVQKIY